VLVSKQTPLVGRGHDLDRLRDVVDATTGSGAVVVVTGEAGIGKTALVEAALHHARGFLVLRCAGHEGEAPTGFAALHELLHPVLPHVDALTPRQRGVLRRAFAVEDGPPPEHLGIGVAVLALLEEVAAATKVLLVVEDLQWLDRPSVAVLTFLARRLTGGPILLVLTTRSALSTVPAEHLVLEPLSREDSTALLAATAPRLDEATRNHVLREAMGNPLALLELASLPPGDAEFPVRTTPRLEQAHLGQVADLPAPSRTLLLLAAADQDLTVTDLLTAAAGMGLSADDLDPLERGGHVDVDGDRVRVRRSLLRSVVYRAASTAERGRAHLALAAVARDPLRAAWHRSVAATGRDEALAADLEAAASRAVGRGARAEAAAVLHRAADLSPDVACRVRRLAATAEVARQAGLPRAAQRAVAEALPLAEDAAVVVRLMTTDIVNALMAGLPASGDGVVGVVRNLADHPVERTALLWAAAVREAVLPHERDGGQAILAELENVGESAGDPRLRIASGLLGRAPRPHDLLPPSTTDAGVLLSAGLLAERLHDLGTAHRSFLACRDQVRHAEADGSHALAWLACVRVLVGEVRDGAADAARAERVATDLGLSSVAAAAAASGAMAHAWRGDDVETARAHERSLAQPCEVRWRSTTARGHWAAGIAALRQRRFRDASAHLAGVEVHRTTSLWALGDVVEAAVHSGRTDVAAAALADAEHDVSAFDSPHLWMLVHRGHALVGTDPVDRFESAVAAGLDSPAVLEVARTRLAYGEWLRRGRRVVEAREQLAEAVRLFTTRGAQGWADRAAAELRAAGVTPPRSAAAAHLTPQEAQIADLAAAGLSNKEIAERVFLSHRTVGAHLYRVFPKLGVTSRAQLARALRDATP